MTDAGTADYAIGTATYWDADQLQKVLDRHRVDLRHVPLQALERWTGGGSVGWFEYQAPAGNLEATDGGTAVFVIQDSTGGTAGTAAWMADYRLGLVTFAADQGGTAYYLTARTYNLNAAAADVWRAKAANVAALFDFSTDNHSVSRSQMSRQFLDMARYYDSQQGAQTVSVIRGDLA